MRRLQTVGANDCEPSTHLPDPRTNDSIAVMKEIVLTVERDDDSGWFVASWDAPDGSGGITTQGRDLGDLQTNVRDAVRCHFGKSKTPATIRLHFITDPVVLSP